MFRLCRGEILGKMNAKTWVDVTLTKTIQNACVENLSKKILHWGFWPWMYGKSIKMISEQWKAETTQPLNEIIF